MNSRRNNLQGIKINYQKMPNIGLWLDKFIVDHEKESKGKSNLVNEVTAFADPKDTENWIYKTYFENTWKPNLVSFGAKYRKGEVKNRLAVNLGSESVLETSIALHRVFGIPFIPGSALKGLASHFLHQYGGSDCKKESCRTKQGDYHAVVFGNQDNAGFVTFYDALYIPNSGFNGKPLYADVMTTHHPNYYGEKKENNQILPPADWDSPNPVPFISATGEYLIALSGPDDWVDLTFDILGYALQVEGVGAKTSSGYGRLSLEDESGNYGSKYEIPFIAPSALESKNSQTTSNPQPLSDSNRIAQNLIQRIAVLRINDVASHIPHLAQECLAIENEEEKNEVANVIVSKIIEVKRVKISSDKTWYRKIISVTEGTEWVIEESNLEKE